MAATWEYLTSYYNTGRITLDQALADAGAQGWELVSTDFAKCRLVFKRPKGGA